MSQDTDQDLWNTEFHEHDKQYNVQHTMTSVIGNKTQSRICGSRYNAGALRTAVSCRLLVHTQGNARGAHVEDIDSSEVYPPKY